MFAKVFEQIFDSSIAEDWRTRLVFEDFLKLADINGVVDKTPEAISRRTNVPLEIVKHGIEVLEQPDPRSRRNESDGRRIVRLDDHRDWGWLIVNYEYYRNLASEEQRRSKNRERVRRYREKERNNDNVTSCNASVTDANDSPSASTSSSTCEFGKSENLYIYGDVPYDLQEMAEKLKRSTNMSAADWQRYVATELENIGYQWKLEVPQQYKNPEQPEDVVNSTIDIVAEMGQSSYAIEYDNRTPIGKSIAKIKAYGAGMVVLRDTSPDKPKTFKQWNREDLLKSVNENNHDHAMEAADVQDFVDYWMEPTPTGRSRMSLEKTWDTRRRMKTALRMVYEPRRVKGGMNTRGSSTSDLIAKRQVLNDLEKEYEGLKGLRWDEDRKTTYPQKWKRYQEIKQKIAGLKAEIEAAVL